MANNVKTKANKYNIVVMGDQYVGKSSIIERFYRGRFGPNYVCTIGSEFYKKEIEIKGKPITLFVFDTAGQENMKTVIKSIYRRAQGILLVFDYTRQRTLDHIHEWINLIEMNCDIMPELLLVGNKIDIPETNREVRSRNAQVIAESKEMNFLKVSAKTNFNIDEAFEDLSMQIYENRRRLYPTEVAESIKLQEYVPKKECCLG